MHIHSLNIIIYMPLPFTDFLTLRSHALSHTGILLFSISSAPDSVQNYPRQQHNHRSPAIQRWMSGKCYITTFVIARDRQSAPAGSKTVCQICP